MSNRNVLADSVGARESTFDRHSGPLIADHRAGPPEHIMDRKELTSIKRELQDRRQRPQRAARLERLAGRLGRESVRRGKHLMWESSSFPSLRVVAIPHHGGKELPEGTKIGVLDLFEYDVIAWKKLLNEVDEEQG